MPSWVLKCPNCEQEFEHAKIDDTKVEDYLFPVKPVFPVLGLEIKCAHCGHEATYKRSDLTYRS
jgi:DNA-directed RNA polymerase subunit RPC12/RpoP